MKTNQVIAEATRAAKTKPRRGVPRVAAPPSNASTRKDKRLVERLLAGGDGQSLAASIKTHELIAAIEAGLPARDMEMLQEALGVGVETLAALLGISKATLHRRKGTAKLGRAESERIVRYARLMGIATGVLESAEDASEWLKRPQHGLGGAIPLEYAQTELGAREVEDLLGRIEHGVYA